MIAAPWFLTALVVGPAVFWLLPERRRMPWLAALSAAYLCTITVPGTLAAAAWAVAFHRFARTARTAARPRRITGSLILAILGYLAVFKYLPAVVASLATFPWEVHVVLPLGISYYTFKLIHYAVEVGRGRVQDPPLADVLAWTLLFPAFTAGPIERFDHFQANRVHAFDAQLAAEGGTRILHGLIKKLFVADVIVAGFAGDVDHFLANLHAATPLDAWRFCFLMFVFGYLDFSAYSDIAIGAARLFGIRLGENFDWPILAPNISQFWKRWHLSLAQWVQAYVYLPFVGITRNPYAALFASFTTLGIWHGAAWNWVLWGVYHATGVALHLRWTRFLKRRGWQRRFDGPGWRAASIAATLAYVTAANAFTTTASRSAADGLALFARLFGLGAA